LALHWDYKSVFIKTTVQEAPGGYLGNCAFTFVFQLLVKKVSFPTLTCNTTCQPSSLLSNRSVDQHVEWTPAMFRELNDRKWN